MEYQELNEFVKVYWENDHVTFRMSLQDFLDGIFWRGTAQAGERDVWEYGPSGRGHEDIDKWKDSSFEFTHEGKQYKMKVVEAFNQNVRAGEKVWWKTKEYTDPSVPAPPKEWQYATLIEMTREGDPDVLRIYQTYGEPHGVWEWDLQKLDNPMAINQLRFK